MTNGPGRPERRSPNADTADIPPIGGIRSRRNNTDWARPQNETQHPRRGEITNTAPLEYETTEYEETPGSGGKKKKKKKQRSTGYRFACTVLVILIVATVGATGFGLYYFHLMDYTKINIGRKKPAPATPPETAYVEDGEEIRTIVPIHEGAPAETTYDVRQDLYDTIKSWKEQGDPNYYLQSTKVINFLLAGIDRNEDGSDGRSDSMMLVSVDLKTKRVVLSSIFRDCWFYATFDDESKDTWCKINESFAYGGAAGLIANIEDYFKIHIDHYVGVDFDSFRDIIDGVGGIDVSLLENEARYINEQTCYTANPAVAGDRVHLDGFQALWYVRMRHVDADEEVGRTRRQRQFVSAMIEKFKDTSVTELGSLVNKFMGYVQTDMSKTEILAYGTRAILGQWYNYAIEQQHVPDDEHRIEAFRSGYFAGKWVWVCDFPGAAQAMQKKIYGYSNVVLNSERRTALDIWSGMSYDWNGSDPGYGNDYGYENDYGYDRGYDRRYGYGY